MQNNMHPSSTHLTWSRTTSTHTILRFVLWDSVPAQTYVRLGKLIAICLPHIANFIVRHPSTVDQTLYWYATPLCQTYALRGNFLMLQELLSAVPLSCVRHHPTAILDKLDYNPGHRFLERNHVHPSDKADGSSLTAETHLC